MAENIQGNPINVNVPANVTITQGKTNLSTFKKQLQDAEKEMGRALTSVEKGELKTKIIAQAHAQRQLLGLSLYGNASSYSMKKFANEPNPSNVKEYMSQLVKPKSLVGARGGGLDKEIMEREREIAFILKSLKLPLPKGTTGIAAQQQTEVKSMSRIFNKVKKDQAVELDVQKFYQSAANLKALYEKDVTSGGMSKKAYLGRIKELEALSVKFEARAKVSRHEMEPLSAIGKSLVKGPVISATKQLASVNKAVAKATTAVMTGAGSPQALAAQAIADAARDSVLGKKTIKKVVKQATNLQKAVLGASFGGDPTNLARTFDLQALAVPNIKKALANKLAKEMRKAGITEFTTAGTGGSGGGSVPTVPTGGAGDAFGGFRASAASAGAYLLDVLKDKLVQFSGFAAGVIGKAVTMPLTLAFGQVRQNVQDAFKEGPEMIADMTRMAVPLALKTGDWKQSMQGVEEVFRQVTGSAVILPEEIGKIAFSYTRVAKETKGLVSYLKEISLLHSFTEESLQNIDDMVLEWAQAFNIDIPNGAAKIASDMTTIASMTDVSVPEMRGISAWLTPIFAQQKDREKALRDEMALSGLLAQRGSKLPIMVRGMQGAISQLQTPSNSMLGLLASMDLQIYKMKDGTTGWANTYKEAGKQLKVLYAEQNRLNKAAAGGMAGPNWVAQSKALNDKIKEQEAYLAEMFSTWQDGGLIVEDTLGALSQLAKLMENPGTQARFLKEIKGSSRDTFLQLLQTVQEAKRLSDYTAKHGEDTNKIIKKAMEGTSVYQAQRATASRKEFFNTLEQRLVEPLRVPFFKAFANLFDQWNKDKGLQKSLMGMSDVISAIGTQYITPAVAALGDLMSTAFMGGPEADKKTAAASEALKSLVTGFLGRIVAIAGPVITPIGELVGNLFMLGFISVLNSGLVKQLAQILTQAGKQLIVGLYEQAGGAGKMAIRSLFPFVGKQEELSGQLARGRKAYGYSSTDLTGMYSSYMKSPTTYKGAFKDEFDALEKEGLILNAVTGEVEVANTALIDLQNNLKGVTLGLNSLSTAGLTAKNLAELALQDKGQSLALLKTKAALALAVNDNPTFGSAEWHAKYRSALNAQTASTVELQTKQMSAIEESTKVNQQMITYLDDEITSRKAILRRLATKSPAPAGNQL